MPIPELNLSLGLTDNDGSVFYAGSGEGKVIVRTDSALKQHTISITISEQQIGSVNLKTHFKGAEIPAEIEIPTYQMIVTDDKTDEKEIYKVTRDTYFFKEQTTKKGLWSFLGLKFLATKNFLFENIPFEPLKEEIETFDISRYRKLNHDELTYTFQKENQNIQIFAGDINTLKVEKGTSYFVIVDEKKGQRFIGDILYREKFLKLTPKVKLHVIKRKQVSKAMETNKQGQTDRLIYI
ncbi:MULTISPECIES: hypothetical protein [unclassified Flavobacterium]|jgi:hypothetical protein|uniref:hypothetical protein n=1 Tax=unclassified Flavobacterium TaxID=196869 RepID=UPI00057FC548|nr:MULTISPECIES: hypothetical protein [unclassified Flavobacterium]KIA98880.1 hypothetical protein OA93_08330 [Flavobacterium sp. KMS]KIC03686.1 hypothetical protein OA88_02745 [Flavobacterium sp. JRM]MEA9412101.1 hypothetical protein [Flavobacterium sp. PL02]